MSPGPSASKSRPPTYEERVAAFSFESIAAHLSGDLRNGVNACVECCDRHVAPGRVALEWEARTDAAPPIHLNKCAIFRRVSRTI